MEPMLKFLLPVVACLALSACESPLSDVKEGANAGKAPANNASPSISAIPDDTTFLNAVKTIPFKITDPDSTLDCQRSVTVTASNQSLLPGTYVTLAGTAPNCTMSLRPAGGVSGTTAVTAVVYDGAHRASVTFNLQVLPPVLTAADASVSEGSSLSFAVHLSQAASSSISVAYATANGTGIAGTNYTAASGTILFAAGETSKTVAVATRDDATYSTSKTMTIGFTAFGSTVNATGTIQNTDPAIPTASAITPADFDEDTESGLITLSYAVADGALASSCSVTSPLHVSVTQACACDVAGVCTLKVTGASNYHGSASFAYTVHANGVASNSATASLTVSPVSDAPVANSFSPSAFDADVQSGLITLDYTAVGGDLATSCAISSLTHVSETQACACDGAGVCTVKVTGASHYSGAASFGFTVSSGTAASSVATASLTVNLVKTLGISFTAGTTLNSSVTYSRSGGASRVNAGGIIETVSPDVARIEYDPNSHSLNGLLVEEQRMNLTRLGTSLNSLLWDKQAATVTGNAATGPDGLSTAGFMAEDSSASSHEIRLGSIAKPAASAPYTFSIFAKAAQRSSVHLYVFGSSFGDSSGTVCNLLGSGSVASTTSTGAFSGASARVESWPNGWYRCVVSGTSSSAGAIGAAVGLVSSGSSSYTGDGASGAYVWGAQLEAGIGATSYIPDKNLLTYSEALDQSPWLTSAAAASANAAADPAGGTGADSLADDGSLSFHYAYQVVKTPPSQGLTYSFYAKAGASDQVLAQINDDDSSSDNVSAKFDLTNGVVTNTMNSGSGSNASSSITAVGNGWYRCSVSGQASNSGTRLDVGVYLLNGSGSTYYSGGGGGVLVWGHQLEEGTSLSTYWAVTTGPLRGADMATVATSGSWFEASAGTMVSATLLKAVAATGVKKFSASFSDGSTNNLIGQYLSATGGGERLIVSGAAQTDAIANFTASGTNKLATAYQANDLAIYANGSAGTPSTSAVIPNVSSLFLGSDGQGNFLNGWLKSLDYYPIRVSNTMLGTLTQ